MLKKNPIQQRLNGIELQLKVLLYGEAGSTAASCGGVRILDNELSTFQVFLVVDFSADKILIARPWSR